MTNQETHVANVASTTLTSTLSAGATTISVSDTSDFPAVPFYVTIEPGNDSKREIVLVDSAKTSTSFTLSSATKRGVDGTSDVQHDSGAQVAIVPVAAMWADVHDRIDATDSALTSHDHDAEYVDEPAGIDTSTGLVAGDGAGGTELVGRDTYAAAAYETKVDLYGTNAFAVSDPPSSWPASAIASCFVNTGTLPGNGSGQLMTHNLGETRSTHQRFVDNSLGAPRIFFRNWDSGSSAWGTWTEL